MDCEKEKFCYCCTTMEQSRELEVKVVLVVGRKLHSVILDFTRKPARALLKCKYKIWKSPKLLSLMNAKCTQGGEKIKLSTQ